MRYRNGMNLASRAIGTIFAAAIVAIAGGAAAQQEPLPPPPPATATASATATAPAPLAEPAPSATAEAEIVAPPPAVAQTGDPRLLAMRQTDAGVLELRLPRDYDNDARAVLERVVPTQFGQTYVIVDQGPIEDGVQFTLSPGRYRLTATAPSAVPTFADLQVHATEVLSYGVRPGNRSLSDGMMIGGVVLGGIGLTVGYVVLLAGLSEASYGSDEDELVALGGLMMLGGIAVAILSFVLHESHDDPRTLQLGRVAPVPGARGPDDYVPAPAAPVPVPGMPTMPPGYGEPTPVAPQPATPPPPPSSPELDSLPPPPPPPQ